MHCIVDAILSGHDIFISKEWLSLLSYCTICLLYCVVLLFIYLLTSVVLNSKRVSGFDQAPPQQALPIVAAGAIPGMIFLYIYLSIIGITHL